MNRSDHRAVVRGFLSSRRARISPEQVGLAAGGRRRVTGLRREEVALLAGVSTEWYTRLEKGHIGDVSEDVLHAVAGALRLDGEERKYLLDLSRGARTTGHNPPPPVEVELPPQVQWMLDSITMSAAVVTDKRWNVVGSNALGRALFSPMLDSEGIGRANVAWFHFLDPAAHDLHADWETAADYIVALLLTQASRRPDDPAVRGLICDLMGIPEFRRRWEAHQVVIHHRGSKTLRHPDAGPLELTYYSVELPTSTEDGLLLTTYTAEPGSPAQERLRILASWAEPYTRSRT